MASITKKKNRNGQTAYVIRVYAGKDGNGRSKYLSRTFTPAADDGEGKIRREIRRLTAQLEEGAGTGGGGRTQKFRTYTKHFMEVKARKCQPYTLRTYRQGLDVINRYLGSIPLGKIRAQHLDRMYGMLAQRSTQYGAPYSGRTIRYLHSLVRMVLGLAVMEGILAQNVADKDHYVAPRSLRSRPQFLELDEAREYVRCALLEKDLRIRCMVLLFLFTGIRREELCGLEWKDIDFRLRRIHIRRASVYVSGLGVITKLPKTESGVRILSADPLVFESLQLYRKRWEMQQKKKPALQDGADRLFQSSSGGPILPNVISAWLERFVKKYHLRFVTPHKLRHTYATPQIAYGTDIRTVAGAMGHSTPSTTLNIYAHQLKESSQQAAAAMSSMLIAAR